MDGNVKKNFVAAGLLVIALMMALMTGCAEPGAGDVPDDGPKGTLVFRLATGNDRAILGSDLSSGLANTWELLLIDSGGGLKTLTMEAGQTASLALSPGDYQVLALAGFRRSTTSLTTQLLGSACSSGPVTVVENQSQTLTLTLRAIDFTFTYPASVEAGADFVCSAAGQSRNPCLGMGIEGGSAARPRLRSTVLWGGYKDFPVIGGSPGNWTATLTATAPSATGVADIGFCGSPLVLVSCGSADGSLTGRTAYSWKWPNTYDLQDTDALKALVQGNLNLVTPATGIGVTLVWE